MESNWEKTAPRTNYHFDIKTKANGSGMISIKFSNEADFNDIYEYLLK